MMPINLGYYNKMKANKEAYDNAKKAELDSKGNTIATNIPTATPSPVQQSRFTNANAPTSIQPNTTTQAQKLADTMAAYDRQGKQLKAEAYAQYRANRDATRNQIAQSYQSYQNQQATAGAKAEQLKAMGMTGSGYTDYMNSQNYGAYRQNVGNAYNTQAYNDTSVANTLQTNMNALEQAKIQTQATYDTAKAQNYSDAYTNILNAVNDGTYNDSMLDVLTSGGYIDDNQKATLSAMANALTEKNRITNSGNALVNISANPSDYNMATINALYSNKQLTDTDYAQAVATRQKYSQQLFEEQIAAKPTDFNLNNLLALLDGDEISKEYFDKKLQSFLQTNPFREAKLTKAELDEAYGVFKDLHNEKQISNNTMVKIDDYYRLYNNELMGKNTSEIPLAPDVEKEYNDTLAEFSQYFKDGMGQPYMHIDGDGNCYVEMGKKEYDVYPRLIKFKGTKTDNGTTVKIVFQSRYDAITWMKGVIEAKKGG